jgi:hypothetical protein
MYFPIVLPFQGNCYQRRLLGGGRPKKKSKVANFIKKKDVKDERLTHKQESVTKVDN